MAAAYSEKQTKELIEDYLQNPTSENVKDLATKYRRTPKSIIAKLSKEGVYQRKVYLTKKGEIPRSKAEILSSIEDKLSVAPDTLSSLVKANRDDCRKLESIISQLVGDFSALYSEFEEYKENVRIAKDIGKL